MRRRVVAGVLAALGLVSQAPAAAAPAGPDWVVCGTTNKGECATVPVPVDWAAPDGRKLDLAIGRLRALDPTRRIGVLFIHPGGPGSSGIDAYITGRRIRDDSPLRQYFDIVSVDPRGVGRSNPVVCSAELVDQAPSGFPATEAQYRAWLDYNGRLSDDCRRNTGPVFDHVDTLSVVRDVDAVRAALGERKISFYGMSYGTQVGQQYAELFPGHIRAMVLDSNMDHSITDPFTYLSTAGDDFESALTTFADWCAGNAACALHGEPVLGVWDALHAKAAAGTLVDPAEGTRVTAEALRNEAFSPAMYVPSPYWFPLAERLASLYDGSSALSAPTRPAALANHPYPAIWCSDWRWEVPDFARLDDIRRQLAARHPHTLLSPFWFDVVTCLGWHGEVRNPQHRLSIEGAPPILLATATHDAATPAAWNRAVAAQIPDAVLLEYAGVGHGQYRNSTCARFHIERHLITTLLPPADTRCPAELPTRPPAKPPSFAGQTVHPTHSGESAVQRGDR
jgi:pimeloyl-ACP methyl ester carboxylesterase